MILCDGNCGLGHLALTLCIIGNPSEAGYCNHLVKQYNYNVCILYVYRRVLVVTVVVPKTVSTGVVIFI